MGLLDRVEAARGARHGSAVARREASRSSIDTWISQYLIPSQFSFGGQLQALGLNQLYGGQRAQEIERSLPGYMAALRQCPPAFAAQMVRALVLSQARFTFRSLPSAPVPRKQFGTSALAPLESPWPNATSGELITRAEWHAGVAGNAYVTNWTPGRLRVLRPDWVAIVYGSQREPEFPSQALDGELLGYVYQNGGLFSEQGKPMVIPPRNMAHWSPLPDPLFAGIGMSWITPAVREIQGDVLATQHKIRFFENGATPNLVVKGLTAESRQDFDELVEMMEASHAGLANAYRTLYLVAGADATVVGADLKQIDFKATQGAGETRIAALSRVHPVILGLSEGLAGSSLNAGNFGMARRIWGDTWIYPTLQDLCRALSSLVEIPVNRVTGLRDSELWYDTADMPILREDAKDAAEITQIQIASIGQAVKDGFTRQSAVTAVVAQNPNLLVPDPDWVSVQLQSGGGAVVPASSTNGTGGG